MRRNSTSFDEQNYHLRDVLFHPLISYLRELDLPDLREIVQQNYVLTISREEAKTGAKLLMWQKVPSPRARPPLTPFSPQALAF